MILIIILLILYLLWDVYRFIFCRRQPPLLAALLDKKGHDEDYYVRRDKAAGALRSAPCERYSITSERGETLQGFYYPCGEGHSKKIAFIVHGFRSEHAETAGVFMETYHSRGFDIFSPDNTSSGESGGKFFGYDVFESADNLKWLAFLQSRFGDDIEIILHGFSLGGATVMKMSDRVPSCVKFVIEDSGFIDARQVLKAQTSILYKLMAWLHKLLAGCDLSQSDVRPSLKNSKVPFLVVHGEGDKLVPFSMAPQVYECCPNEKDFLFTPQIKHIETIHYNKAAYEEKIDAFIEKYI